MTDKQRQIVQAFLDHCEDCPFNLAVGVTSSVLLITMSPTEIHEALDAATEGEQPLLGKTLAFDGKTEWWFSLAALVEEEGEEA